MVAFSLTGASKLRSFMAMCAGITYLKWTPRDEYRDITHAALRVVK